MQQREGLLSRNHSNQELRERDRMGDYVVGGGHSPSGHAGGSSGGNVEKVYQSPSWQSRFLGFKRDVPHLVGSPGNGGIVDDIVKPLVGSVTGGGGGGGGDTFHAGNGEGLGHMTGKNHKRTPPALKLALVTWLLGCSLVVIRVYSAANERVAALANLYYQAPAIVIMALWLWVRGDLGDLRGHIYIIYEQV